MEPPIQGDRFAPTPWSARLTVHSRLTVVHTSFATRGIHVRAVMTDDALAATDAVVFHRTVEERGGKHVRIRPRRSQATGKAARLTGPSSRNGPASAPTVPARPGPG